MNKNNKLDKEEITKKFENKHVIDPSEIKVIPFDILKIKFCNTLITEYSLCKLIVYKKKLDIITCSVLYFDCLEILGEAKHEIKESS